MRILITTNHFHRYDRFAGPEGLRGLCSIKSICEDRIPWLRNSIPAAIQYPNSGVGFHFLEGLIKLFYSTTVIGILSGLVQVIKYSIVSNSPTKKGKTD